MVTGSVCPNLDDARSLSSVKSFYIHQVVRAKISLRIQPCYETVIIASQVAHLLFFFVKVRFHHETEVEDRPNI